MFQKIVSDTKFLINPSKLSIDNKAVINEEASRILTENNIKIEINVYDSDITNFTKPTIVFLHGNSASKKIFENQIKHFSKDYRVIAIDLIGHGDSTTISSIGNLTESQKQILCEALYNPIAMVAEVTQLLEAKGVHGAHLIGWSLGGHIAYGVAVENKNLVASITTIGSPPVKFSTTGFEKGFNPWFVNTLVPEWVNQPKQYTLEEAAGISQHIGFRAEDPLAKDMTIADPQMRRHLFLKLKDYDKTEYTGSVLDGEQFAKQTDIPLCLMVGENDGGINAQYFSSFQRELRNPASRIVIVKEAPHAIFKTHSEEYYHVADSFLAQVKPKEKPELI